MSECLPHRCIQNAALCQVTCEYEVQETVFTIRRLIVQSGKQDTYSNNLFLYICSAEAISQQGYWQELRRQ